MIKSSIKKIVVLPLFIATLLTSFYVMQPQMADASHGASIKYKNSGDDSETPLASDRFDAIEDGYVDTIHSQTASSSGGASLSKISLELQQFIDCERGTAPEGTCESILMSGTQNVDLNDGSASGFVDVEADLFMLQKDDTEDQDNVDNSIIGTQTLRAATSGSGSASIDISHNGGENELNMNMYQYNKRGSIDETTSDFEIDDIEAAIDDDNGSGNDDSRNINYAEQIYDADARDNSLIQAATQGDQDFTVAQFNAGCDDSSDTVIDITCENQALQNIELDSIGSTQLNFNTPSAIEMQQVNTCAFSDDLNCLNDGKLDVNVFAGGSGVANVELENNNGKPVLFQENTCSDLDVAGTSNIQDCTNTSYNFFDVNKQGATNIEKTNLDLQIAQKNDCEDATAPIDCINKGLVSGITDLNGRNIQSEFGEANTIVTVNTRQLGTAGGIIEDADPDSFLTMVNDCDYANPSGSSACVNEGLNEAHFVAFSGANVDVDRVVQESKTTNTCDDLDGDACNNTAHNSFTANAANNAVINMNGDITQTNTLDNNCYSAECNNSALNFMLLNADDKAIITAASTSDIDQSNKLYNGCTAEADCSNIGSNSFTVIAEGEGSDVDISKMIQTTSLSNTCSGSTTVCSNNALNDYDIVNTSGEAITSSTDQNIVLANSYTSGTHNNNVQNTLTLSKTGGTSFSFSGTQSSTNGVGNTYTTSPTASGSCSLSQTNGQTQTSGSC